MMACARVRTRHCESPSSDQTGSTLIKAKPVFWTRRISFARSRCVIRAKSGNDARVTSSSVRHRLCFWTFCRNWISPSPRSLRMMGESEMRNFTRSRCTTSSNERTEVSCVSMAMWGCSRLSIA
jgi:hypothetical protein